MTQPLPRLTLAALLSFVVPFLFSSVGTIAAAVELPIPIAQLERTEPVDFHKEIMPLLRRSCVACHHERLAEGGLKLETPEQMLAGGDSGPAVVAGDVAASLLLHRASGEEEPLMPPEDNAADAQPLTPEELGLISLWIEQGANANSELAQDQMQWQPIAPSLRPIYAVDVSSDGQFVASSRGNQVVIHDRYTHQLVGQLVDPRLPAAAGENAADIDLVQSLAFSPDGELLATGGFRSVKLWAKHYPALAIDETRWADASGPAARSADGTHGAVVSAIGDIELWNLESNERVTVLSGHADPIGGVAFSASGERIISSDASGQVVLWNRATGERISEVTHPRPVVQTVFTADGQRAAVLDVDRRVSVYKVAEETAAIEPLPLEALQAIQDGLALAWIPGESVRLAVATEAATVLLIDGASGAVSHTLQLSSPAEQLAADPAGQQLAIAGRDGQIQVWNAQSGELARSLSGDPRRLRQAEQIERDLQRQQGQLERLKAQHDELQKRLTSEDEAIGKATEARDQSAQAVAEQTKKVEEANAALAATEAMIAAANQRAADLEKQIAQHNEAAAAAAASATEPAAAEPAAAEPAAAEAASEEVAAAEGDAERANAEPAEGEATPEKAPEAVLAELNAQLEAARAEAAKLTEGLEAQKKAVTAAQEAKTKGDAELAKLQSALDGLQEGRQRLVQLMAEHDNRTARETGRRQALELSQQRFQQRFAEQTPVAALAFAPQSQALATAHRDGTVRVYFGDETTARIVLDDPAGRTFAGDGRQLHFSDDRSLVVFGAGEPAHGWQLLPQWTLQQTIGSLDDSPISDRVTAIDFHPTRPLIAVGSGPASRSGQLQIFTTDSGRLLREFANVHSDTVLSVKFSPDGRLLASSAADKVIRLLNVTDGQVIRSLEGHTHHVLAITWHHDAVTLASAGADQSVKIWNTETGEQKRTIGGMPKEATALRFVKDSSELLTAGADGHVRLHNVDNGSAIRSFNAAGDFLFSLTVTPDGTHVLSGGQNGVLRSWVIADGKLAAEIQ